jgi:hypothetical protein
MYWFSVQLYAEKTIRTELKDLAALQDTDPRLAAIKREVTAHPTTTQLGYLLRDSAMYCKGDKVRTRWKECCQLALRQKCSDSCTTLGDVWVSINVRRKLHVRDFGKKLWRIITSCDVCRGG